MKQMINRFINRKEYKSYDKSFLLQHNFVRWSSRRYDKFAEEAYIKNVIAHRAINMISQAASSVQLKLTVSHQGKNIDSNNHPLFKILNQPNPTMGQKEFMEALYTYRQISGNAFIHGVTSKSFELCELYLLRPDRVEIVEGKDLIPKGYVYKTGEHKHFFATDNLSGSSEILHIKNFHPLSDWYGLSSIEAAAYSIDQHNQAGIWNQSLLQNSARPSGAFVVKGSNKNEYGNLTNEQIHSLRELINSTTSGAENAGRPLLLEGGLEWQEMSLSPKDMDFISTKHSAARDIALAIGIPPQLLGIPGDNTYSNMQEARLSFWEQTVIPLVDNVVTKLSNWLNFFYPEDISLTYDLDNVPALSGRREALWDRLEKCTFLSNSEKRKILGFDNQE